MFPMAAGSPSGKTYIEDVFSAYTYTGNGSTQTINNGIDLAGKGGIVVIKDRPNASAWNWYSTIRGAGVMLASNSTSAELARPTGLTAFSSTGFTLGSNGEVNSVASNPVSFTFRKAAKFFDVVQYTGNGVASRTVAHSLGQKPGMIVIKATSATDNWPVYHQALGATQAVLLNLTNAAAGPTGFWNSTEPTDSVFTLGNAASVNSNGVTYIAYLFAHDTSNDGLIQCGSFTTDGSGNATVNLGWEPQFVIAKKSGTTSDWYTYDSARGFVAPGANNRALFANSSAAEADSALGIRLSSTGLAVSGLNPSESWIYLAIRRGPMRKPTSGTQVYQAIARSGTNSPSTINGVGFPPDWSFTKSRSMSMGGNFVTRLTNSILAPQSTSAETTPSPFTLTQDGAYIPSYIAWADAAGETYINYFLRRYPGVFDIVAYTGTGSARTVPHNLGVAPELMIVKRRNSGTDAWAVYAASQGAGKYLLLNSTAAADTASADLLWNSTAPTAASFSVKTSSYTNSASGEYIAYLFATLAGVSKVGGYMGDGTTNRVIDCGFAGGARFILLKKTSVASGWYMVDTVRGITASADPNLQLQSTGAEDNTSDIASPAAAGFIPGAFFNTAGHEVIYLALA